MSRTTTIFERIGIARPVAFILAMIGVLAVGLFLRVNPTLWRPLDHDEISSANTYTSIGYISTISQLRAEPALRLKRLAAGFARTFFIWNQNNHMIHSLALSVGVFLLGASEATVRAAALAASVATALLLMLWAVRRTRFTVIAAFCGLVIAVHPYFIHYGQTARGYSWTTLLLLLHVLLTDEAEAGKKGMARLGLSILVGSALFLNLTSSLFLWLAPLYASMLWREVSKPGPGGIWARIRGEAFGWWFFQAAAVACFVLFFGLDHLLMFVKSQADYGIKLASAPAALHRLVGVFPYLFPGQWLLLPLAGAAGWACMLKSKYWLAGPIAGSFLAIALYVIATRTVPYDRTFGIWIVFAVMGCAWLWKQWLASPSLAAPATAWLPQIGAVLLLVSAIIWPHSVVLHVSFEDAAKEISRQVSAKGDTPRNTFIVVPFLTYEESRLYLPDDSAFLSLPSAPPQSLTVYLPCKSFGPDHDGFRCTYYHRNSAEWVFFQIPESWRSFETWRKEDFSILRLDATGSSGAASILPNVPQIVIWRAANSFFDLDRYVTERLVGNPALPEFRFVTGYYFSTPTLIFFVNGDAAPLKNVLADLDATTPGSVLVLTPKGQ